MSAKNRRGHWLRVDLECLVEVILEGFCYVLEWVFKHTSWKGIKFGLLWLVIGIVVLWIGFESIRILAIINGGHVDRIPILDWPLQLLLPQH
jgi:hypothetical protein